MTFKEFRFDKMKEIVIRREAISWSVYKEYELIGCFEDEETARDVAIELVNSGYQQSPVWQVLH